MTPEQIAQLTPEQLVIAERWEEETKKREVLFDLLAKAVETKDDGLWRETILKLDEMTPRMCEHERSVWSNCHACNEIEAVLHPELFCAECGVPFGLVSSDEAEKEHKAGDICPDCIYEKGHPKDRGAAIQKCITCGWETGTSTIHRDQMNGYDPRCARCNTNTMYVIEGSFQVSERYKDEG